jgi:hypothetical protein
VCDAGVTREPPIGRGEGACFGSALAEWPVTKVGGNRDLDGIGMGGWMDGYGWVGGKDRGWRREECADVENLDR